MKASNFFVLIILVLYFITDIRSQELTISDPWLVIDAKSDDPLYTTYTAGMERSRLYGDKGYKMDYWSTERPLSYSSDKSGSMYCIWKVNEVVVNKIPEYHSKPVVIASFPDMALSHYQPWPGVDVQECFMVYSSKIALVDMHITNRSAEQMNIEIYPVIEFDKDSLCVDMFRTEENAMFATHYESTKRLISNLYSAGGYPKQWRDVFAGNVELYSYGAYAGPPGDFYNIIKTDFYADD
ncbi:MAG: hypothetical protein KAJ50_11055, partial [Bacteroidales bacterium]|nr:hypothetical protein [Bacteroidales bacterium]